MVKRLTLICFGVLALVQWLVPAGMIFKRTQVLEEGTVYRFEVAPIDPEDPFIGRYITLNFPRDENWYYAIPGKRRSGTGIFIQFKRNSRGYAQIANVSYRKPAQNDYLRIEPSYSYERNDSTVFMIEYPFRKYYMEESKAPRAEDVFRNRLRDSTSRLYAAVRIWKGDAVIDNAYINDSTIHQVLKASTDQRP